MGARTMVELTHEKLKRKVSVAEQLVPHYEKNGWKRAGARKATATATDKK